MSNELQTALAPVATRRPGRKRGPKPGTPEAQRGGAAVKAKYGSDFYKQIGQKGGKAARERMGADFYAEIGHKGGSATRDRHSRDYYVNIGRKGGSAEHVRHRLPTGDVAE